MNVSFTKIEKKSLVSEVTDQIHDYILSNKIEADSKLPGELDLASMFGISRPVVREALSRLRYIGLIESKKNKGIIVKKPNIFELFGANLPFLTQDDEFQSELNSFRYILESGAIELAIENGTEKSISAIKQTAIHYRSLVEKNKPHKSLHHADEEFHISIFTAASNKFLLDFSTVITKHFTTHSLESHHTDKHRHEIAEMHLKIAKAIEQKNVSEAQQLMREHLRIKTEDN